MLCLFEFHAAKVPSSASGVAFAIHIKRHRHFIKRHIRYGETRNSRLSILNTKTAVLVTL